ncbi:MAG: 23S rRNA (adenine(2030)-N(6))-methyltransferase RlmJ [Gammaproteobacteria bacterium]
MLSYRHGFHAGNFADVLKHSVLCLVLSALKKKDKPFVYIDTHAGAGLYSLHSEFAEKTGEFRQGIERVLQANAPPESAKLYLETVRSFNVDRRIDYYPGSPALAKALLRFKDRLQLNELHSSDFQALFGLFRNDPQVSTSGDDGLTALIKKLPPIQKRGLILIDPSYEVKDEAERVVETLVKAYRRFATGIYCIWYPVLTRGSADRFMQTIAATGIRRQLRIEHCILPDSTAMGMTGSGLLLINPPWQLDVQAQELLPWLNRALCDDKGRWSVTWQVPE